MSTVCVLVILFLNDCFNPSRQSSFVQEKKQIKQEKEDMPRYCEDMVCTLKKHKKIRTFAIFLKVSDIENEW